MPQLISSIACPFCGPLEPAGTQWQWRAKFDPIIDLDGDIEVVVSLGPEQFVRLQACRRSTKALIVQFEHRCSAIESIIERTP